MRIRSSWAVRLMVLVAVAVCALLSLSPVCGSHHHGTAHAEQHVAAAQADSLSPTASDGCCAAHAPLSHDHRAVLALPAGHRDAAEGLLLALVLAVGFLAAGGFDRFAMRRSPWSRADSFPPDPLWGRSLLLSLSKARC